MTENELFGKCLGLGMTPAGAAGCTANILAESAGSSINVEDRSGIEDESYTRRVDNGTYPYFVSDRYGYGICQWTTPARKQALLTYAQGHGVSVGNADMQFQFLAREMRQTYSHVWMVLTTTKDPYEAGYTMCKFFEIPANTERTSQVRGNKAKQIYDRYAGATPIESDVPQKDWPPRMLCKGMEGADVTVLQSLLVARGYLVNVINGIFDDSTEKAVRNFQTDQNLVVDGVAGNNTWKALLFFKEVQR